MGRQNSDTESLRVFFQTPTNGFWSGSLRLLQNAKITVHFYPRDTMLVSVSVRQKWMFCRNVGWIELVLARRLLSTYTTLRYKEIQVCRKIRVLPAGTFS